MRSIVLLSLLMYSMLLLNPVQVLAEVPEVVGEAAVVIDAKNGQILYEKNPHERMYPASTTKILTAILALENAKLADAVIIPKAACNVDGSSTGLQEGERITLEDLLYALMLNSGNDTAVAIAEHIGGSLDNYLVMMNKKAADLGAKNSNFKNPNGLPDPEHYSTAYDLALISRYAMQNQDFRKIVSTRTKIITREIPDAQVYLDNSNKLLWRYDGAVGVKTGYTNLARQCLVAAASREDRELLAVVLKSEGSIWNDATKLLDHGFNNYSNVALIEAGKVVADVPVRYGVTKVVSAQTAGYLTYNFAKNSQQGIRQEILFQENITAPVQAGSKIGELAFYSGELELGRVDLLAQHEVKRKIWTVWWTWLIAAAVLYLAFNLIRAHNRARRRRWSNYRRKYYL